MLACSSDDHLDRGVVLHVKTSKPKQGSCDGRKGHEVQVSAAEGDCGEGM